MKKYLIIFLLISNIISSPTCIPGKNFCSKCNQLTNLCIRCQNDVLIPNDKGGCEGKKDCSIGLNYCQRCDDKNKLCKLCQTGFHLDDNGGCSYIDNCEISYRGECLKCRKNFILVGKEGGNKICKSLEIEDYKHCEKINYSSGLCEKCEENFFLNKKDKKCSRRENCSESITGECISCNVNYYLDLKDKRKCKPNTGNDSFLFCKESRDGRKCSNCIDDYYFSKDGKCVSTNFCLEALKGVCEKCIVRYYLSSDKNSCTNTNNCKKGDRDSGICIECENSYYLDLYDRQCKSYQKDDNLKYCKIFDKKCTQCKNGYNLGKDGKCSNTKFCVKSENGICNKCYEGYYLDSKNQCQISESCLSKDGSNTCGTISYLTKEEEEIINNAKLTKFASGMGCGCKIPPKLLQETLSTLPPQKTLLKDKNILVDNNSFDDAGVYDLTSFYEKSSSSNKSGFKINELALVSTLDFFVPICDNAYDYGAISCANALSDIYAMGGKPINALSIVTFPVVTLPNIILKEILRGASDKADEANCAIIGGHSIKDTEPKFGLSVNGLVDKKRFWKNNTVKKNNYILLTKKIGTGIIMASLKKNAIEQNDKLVIDAINSMKTLNKYHAEVIIENDIKIEACTDVTGFGLLGHLSECLSGEENKGLFAEIDYSNIPFFDERVKELANKKLSPGGATSNFAYVNGKVIYDKEFSEEEKLLINDPQTSGGLLIFVNENTKKVLKDLFKNNNLQVYEVGKVIERPNNIDSNFFIKINKK